MRAVLFTAGLVSTFVTLSSLLGAQSGARPVPLYILDRTTVPLAQSQLRGPSTNQAVDVRYVPKADTAGGMSAMKRGALVGAGIGFAAGLSGGIWLAQGIVCLSPVETPTARGCNASRQAAGAIVLMSATGTGLGALLGAGVGPSCTPCARDE